MPLPSVILEPKSIKILVAEDDKATRFLLTRALQEDNFIVEQATNGQECLDKFLSLRPDIVLLDGVMPLMDGFTCCQRLRDLPLGADLPVLMITFLDDQASIDKAYQAGATDYITKPVHWSSLRRRIKHLVHTQQLTQQVKQLQLTLVDQSNWYDLWSQSLQLVTRFSPNIATLQALLQQFLKNLGLAQLVVVERQSEKVISASNSQCPLPEAITALPIATYAELLQKNLSQIDFIDRHHQPSAMEPVLALLCNNGSLDLIIQPVLFQEQNLGVILVLSPQQTDGWSEHTRQRLIDLSYLMAIFLQQGRV
jgi:DNA-binding response OmpR family regulator